MFIRVTELPSVLQAALKQAGYHRKDVDIKVQETFYTRPPSHQGRKGYVAACLMDNSNSFEITWGSWGGSNMFVKTIDDIGEEVTIPNNVSYISGMGSGGNGYPASATIYISPFNMNSSWLPKTSDVTDHEATILGCFASFKAAYRREYLERLKATEQEIDSLVTRKYLKRNKRGAMSITTEGRNAAKRVY